MRKTVYFDKYVPYTLERNEDGVRIEKKLKLSSLFNALASSPTGKSLREVFGENTGCKSASTMNWIIFGNFKFCI